MEKEETKIPVKKIPVEIYSRVVGYYRPVSNWNKGKQEEFRNRRTFDNEVRQGEQEIEAPQV